MNLTQNKGVEYLALPGAQPSIVGDVERDVSKDSPWNIIIPRTLMFMRFFQQFRLRSDAVGIVEAVYESGMNNNILETLPEAILIPFKDAISRSQARPPVSWSRELLELVDRSDISLILKPGRKPQTGNSNVMVSDSCSFCVNISNRT